MKLATIEYGDGLVRTVPERRAQAEARRLGGVVTRSFVRDAPTSIADTIARELRPWCPADDKAIRDLAAQMAQVAEADPLTVDGVAAQLRYHATRVPCAYVDACARAVVRASNRSRVLLGYAADFSTVRA